VSHTDGFKYSEKTTISPVVCLIRARCELHIVIESLPEGTVLTRQSVRKDAERDIESPFFGAQ